MKQKDKKPKVITSPDSIREIYIAFQKSRILLTAYELDLFTILGEESKTTNEVANALETDERATDRLMNALVVIGLLQKNKGKFSNTSLTSQYLVKGKPDFMSGMMHAVHLWDSWSTLTQAVRHGGSVLSKRIKERRDKWLTAFIDAMHYSAQKRASGVVAMLDLKGVSRVLDVGGGSGEYSMAFVRAKDGIKATVFDLPKVISLARNFINKEKLLGKVDLVKGDYNVDKLGSDYDLVFVSSIIHSNSPEENQKLIIKASKALNPRGQVVIQDFIVDEDRTSPPFAAIFALNMLVATKGGDTYTESEVRKWMENSGFSKIVRKGTYFGTTLIIGRKF